MTAEKARILYCHCAHSRVVPDDVKRGVLERLTASGADFQAVPDLCEMSACKDPTLPELAGEGPLRIAACYPRAVRWLFHAAGAPLPEEEVHVLNMRAESADEVAEDLFAPEAELVEREKARAEAAAAAAQQQAEPKEAEA